MPKIFLFGYYGFGNLGDELLCDYYIRLFRHHFPDLKLFVLKNNKQTGLQGDNLDYTVVNRWNFGRLWRMMAPKDLLVGGGGSIFQDITSKRSLLYYLTLLRLARWRGLEIILTGQGIGPLSRWGQHLARPVLNMALAIACRDKKSLLSLTRMEVTEPQLYLGVDPLWDYPVPPLFPAGIAKKNPDPAIGFIFRREEYGEKKLLLSNLKSLFGNPWLITLSPEDEQAAQRVAEEMGIPPPRYIHDQRDFFALAADLTLVLSERLHGLLLAARCGLPGIGLGTDPKLQAFGHQMAWPCWGGQEPSLVPGVITAVKAIVADPVSAYERVQRRAAIMEKKGEEDRRWLLNQLKMKLSVV